MIYTSHSGDYTFLIIASWGQELICVDGVDLDFEAYRPIQAAISRALSIYLAKFKLDPSLELDTLIDRFAEIPNMQNEACERIAEQLRMVRYFH
jgi:hypothetical protein